MNELAQKTVCIVDGGPFIHCVSAFKKHFGRTLLYCGSGEENDPSTRIARIGSGIEGVELISPYLPGKNRGLGFFDFVNEIDLFIFPGVGKADLQEHLKTLGKRVWGAGHSADLEEFRIEAKVWMKQQGLPVQPYERIIGLENLRDMLEATKEVRYIKTSGLRGDNESFKHYGDIRVVEHVLDKLRFKYGRKACEKMEFLSESELKDCIETGTDQYVVQGKVPPEVFIGVERKDGCYIQTNIRTNSLGEALAKPLEALRKASGEYKSSNWLSTEVRIHEDDPKKGTLLEPTERIGAPPGEIEMEIVSNWPEICWHGAVGELVPMKLNGKVGIEAIIDTDMGQEQAKTIVIPKELEQWVKFRQYYIEDGAYTILPQHPGTTAIGAVVAIGDDILSTAKLLSERVDKIKGLGLLIFTDTIPKAVKDLHKLEKMGIKFGDVALPKPEEVDKVLG